MTIYDLLAWGFVGFTGLFSLLLLWLWLENKRSPPGNGVGPSSESSQTANLRPFQARGSYWPPMPRSKVDWWLITAFVVMIIVMAAIVVLLLAD